MEKQDNLNQTNTRDVVEQPKKKKGCLKIFLYVFIAFIALIAIIAKCGQSESEKKEKEVIALKEAHCKVEWNNLDKAEKEKILNEFIENQDIVTKIFPMKYLSMDAYRILASLVKYPKTIKIDGDYVETGMIYLSKSDAKIVDVDKGTIEYHKSFTSENKLGMTVKGDFWLKIKYNAGCKAYEIVDFKVE